MANGKNKTARPNILLITCDQYRFPRFSYGAEGGFAEPLKQILGFQGHARRDQPLCEILPRPAQASPQCGGAAQPHDRGERLHAEPGGDLYRPIRHQDRSHPDRRPVQERRFAQFPLAGGGRHPDARHLAARGRLFHPLFRQVARLQPARPQPEALRLRRLGGELSRAARRPGQQSRHLSRRRLHRQRLRLPSPPGPRAQLRPGLRLDARRGSETRPAPTRATFRPGSRSPRSPTRTTSRPIPA